MTRNAAQPGDATDPAYVHGDEHAWGPNHCSHPRCTLGRHSPDVPHSFEQVTGPRRRTAARSAANVAAAVEGGIGCGPLR